MAKARAGDRVRVTLEGVVDYAFNDGTVELKTNANHRHCIFAGEAYEVVTRQLEHNAFYKSPFSGGVYRYDEHDNLFVAANSDATYWTWRPENWPDVVPVLVKLVPEA